MMQTWYIYKGQVSDPTAYEEHMGPLPEIGQTEWQFSDTPVNERGFSHDFLSLEAGMFALAPANFVWEKEWEEPATEADGGWGDWQDGRMSYQLEAIRHWKYDYREECINGVWRWQSRPRKPVVKTLERVIGTMDPTKSYRVSFNEIDGVIDCSSVKMEPL
jgi:hypothetical protein